MRWQAAQGQPAMDCGLLALPGCQPESGLPRRAKPTPSGVPGRADHGRARLCRTGHRGMKHARTALRDGGADCCGPGPNSAARRRNGHGLAGVSAEGGLWREFVGHFGKR